jgi:hypothetical protein
LQRCSHQTKFFIQGKKESSMKKSGTNLTVIHGEPLADLTTPPGDLGETGRHLWASIQNQYVISDSGGLAMLKLACESADRAQRCRRQIDEDGELVRGRTGPRDHPLLKHELAARSFTVRALQRMGLDVEPVKGVGRPPGR